MMHAYAYMNLRRLYCLLAGVFITLLSAGPLEAQPGTLTFVEYVKDDSNGVDGINAGEGLVISPDGENLYATGNYDDALAVFNRNTITGNLTFVEVHVNGVSGVTGLDACNDVAISPDGRYVYTVASTSSALAVFTRDLATGSLTFDTTYVDGAGGADGLASVNYVAISNDGKHLYVAGSGDNSLALYTRDQTTGHLTYQEMHVDGAAGVDGLNDVCLGSA